MKSASVCVREEHARLRRLAIDLNRDREISARSKHGNCEVDLKLTWSNYSGEVRRERRLADRDRDRVRGAADGYHARWRGSQAVCKQDHRIPGHRLASTRKDRGIS